MTQGSPPPVPGMSDEQMQQVIGEIRAMGEKQQKASVTAPNGYTIRAQDSTVIDLDEQLATIDTSPQQVRVAGHTYRVRRDFTPAEARDVIRMAGKADDSLDDERRFWATLVGDEDAERLRDLTETLPNLHGQRIIGQIWVASGLAGEAPGGKLGEA